MTELEIHIRTRPPLTSFTTETLSDKNGLVIRLCPLPTLPASRMQQQIHKMDSVSEDLEGFSEMLEEVEEEEDSSNDVFGMTTCASMPSLVQSSQPSSNPIAIPNSNNSTTTNTNHISASTPPHQHSYLCRVSPWAQCEANSPTSLSSGYGSSPSRFFITASTQTPPPQSYNTFDIRLRFTNSPVNSPTRSPLADIRRAQLRRQILQNSGAERRPRYHSEGSGTDAVQAAGIDETGAHSTSTDPSQPLPDLVSTTAFRPRSNTEPSRPRPEIMVGEQLRRISDEFHLSYEEVRRLRRRREHQGWLSRVIEHFRGGPHHEVVEEERPQNDKHVCTNRQDDQR